MQIASVLTIILGLQLLVTHGIALELYLYWTVWWLDLVMHLLGGVWLAAVWRTLIDVGSLSERRWSLRSIMPLALLVIIGWEVFGIYVEGGFKDGYVADTVSDIVCGIVGVLIGFWLLRRLQLLNK